MRIFLKLPVRVCACLCVLYKCQRVATSEISLVQYWPKHLLLPKIWPAVTFWWRCSIVTFSPNELHSESESCALIGRERSPHTQHWVTNSGTTHTAAITHLPIIDIFWSIRIEYWISYQLLIMLWKNIQIQAQCMFWRVYLSFYLWSTVQYLYFWIVCMFLFIWGTLNDIGF